MHNNTNNNTPALRTRFNFLKTLFAQAPLNKPEYDELLSLAEMFDKKMAKYLKDNREMFV